MAATITTSYLLKAGDHIICSDDIYGGTHRYFSNCITQFGVEISFVDATNLENLENAIRSNTKMIWLETPTNPLMKIVDIEGVVRIRRRLAPEAIVVFDNTFMSPVFQKPLQFGVDIVTHSLTKYVNGNH